MNKDTVYSCFKDRMEKHPGQSNDKAKKRGCGKTYLETTADGKPVFSLLGFSEMPDMMKYYDSNY